METTSETITVAEACTILGVHRNTISRWLREGVLQGKRRPGTQKIHLDRQDVERLAKGE